MTLLLAPPADEQGFHAEVSGRWTPEPLQPDGSRYPTMGYAAAAWINARSKIVLDPWQVELLRRAFLYRKVGDGLYDWVVRDVIVVGPEGLGKSAFFAALGLWLLEGPCLPPAEAPSPHPKPDIPVVSAALSLTRHVHRFAKEHVKDGPLTGRVTVENTKIFRADDEAHRMWFPAGSGAYQQGGGPTAILEEELHVMNAVGVKADGVETIEVISSKRSKRAYPGALKVQRFTITNPDDGDPESILGRRWARAQAALDGTVEAPELLAVHFCAGLPWDLDDPDDLRRGVKQATPSSFADVEAIAAKYEVDRQSPARFRRFSGGLFHATDEQVLPDGALEGCAVPQDVRGPAPQGLKVAWAFDGARNRDTVSLRGCTLQGYGWQHRYWARPSSADHTWRYPKPDIWEALCAALDGWTDSMLAMDDTFYEDMAAELEDRYPGRIIRDYRTQGPAAWEQFRRAVLDGDYRDDASPVLRQHMRNAREVTSRTNKTVKLAKKRDDGRHPIDDLVTATYAFRLAMALAAAADDNDDDALQQLADAWRESTTRKSDT